MCGVCPGFALLCILRLGLWRGRRMGVKLHCRSGEGVSFFPGFGGLLGVRVSLGDCISR